MRKKKKNKQFTRLNDQITARKVLVIHNDQKIGILDTRSAKALAREKDLDLVEIAPKANPPVCLIADYDKWRYEKQKRIKKQQQKKPSLKEIRLSPAIEKHDLDVKISSLNKFLKSGHPVLVQVAFKGRQKAHIDEGEKVIQEVLNAIEPLGKPDSEPKFQGKRISVKISPKSKN